MFGLFSQCIPLFLHSFVSLPIFTLSLSLFLFSFFLPCFLYFFFLVLCFSFFPCFFAFDHEKNYLILSSVFAQHKSFSFEKTTYKTPISGEVGGLQQSLFVFCLCLQNVKSYLFWAQFWAKHVVDVQKHCKYRYFGLLLKPNRLGKQMLF